MFIHQSCDYVQVHKCWGQWLTLSNLIVNIRTLLLLSPIGIGGILFIDNVDIAAHQNLNLEIIIYSILQLCLSNWLNSCMFIHQSHDYVQVHKCWGQGLPLNNLIVNIRTLLLLSPIGIGGILFIDNVEMFCKPISAIHVAVAQIKYLW